MREKEKKEKEEVRERGGEERKESTSFARKS